MLSYGLLRVSETQLEETIELGNLGEREFSPTPAWTPIHTSGLYQTCGFDIVGINTDETLTNHNITPIALIMNAMKPLLH